jgi:hypothetical protein
MYRRWRACKHDHDLSTKIDSCKIIEVLAGNRKTITSKDRGGLYRRGCADMGSKYENPERESVCLTIRADQSERRMLYVSRDPPKAYHLTISSGASRPSR